MPFALLNGSTCGSWACTHSNSFDQHFETKYPPGFSTLFEAYNASPNSLDLTDIAEVDTYSVSGSLARALTFAKRITSKSFVLHFGEIDPVGSDPLLDVYYTLSTFLKAYDPFVLEFCTDSVPDNLHLQLISPWSHPCNDCRLFANYHGTLATSFSLQFYQSLDLAERPEPADPPQLRSGGGGARRSACCTLDLAAVLHQLEIYYGHVYADCEPSESRATRRLRARARARLAALRGRPCSTTSRWHATRGRLRQHNCVEHIALNRITRHHTPVEMLDLEATLEAYVNECVDEHERRMRLPHRVFSALCSHVAQVVSFLAQAISFFVETAWTPATSFGIFAARSIARWPSARR